MKTMVTDTGAKTFPQLIMAVNAGIIKGEKK